MTSIRVLPSHVAARIAAGEVVERPASAVKELVENALDAGAGNIEVTARGESLLDVAVADDGHGMPPEDLAKCLLRHATSKLDGDDLRKVSTLGYRGEALPSMAAFATVRVTSRPKGQDVAFTVASGGVTSPRPCSGKDGTRVEVSGLFESHPARLKFLKSRKSEAAAIREAVNAAALARPGVGFRLSVGGSECRYPPRPLLRDRAADVLGREYADDSVDISHVVGEISVRGLACLPSAARPDPSGMRFYVNGRPVTDKVLRAAVQSAYASLIGPGKHPKALIMVDAPGWMVDVNVHPRKSEVRFMRPADVSSAVIAAIGKALSASGMRSPSALPDLARRLAQVSGNPSGDRRRLPLGRFLGQANGSWIVAETADGIVIVDQHAAHERIVLERLKASGMSASAGSFAYPSPRRREVAPAAAAAVHDALAFLRQAGFSVDAGDGHVEISAVPADLALADLDEIVDLVVSSALSGAESGLMGEALWERLATAACKAAIKAGNELSPEQADALLRDIESTPNASWCNHGRPTVAFLKDSDIAKLFART